MSFIFFLFTSYFLASKLVTSFFDNKIFSFSRVLYFSFQIGTSVKFESTDPIIEAKGLMLIVGLVKKVLILIKMESNFSLCIGIALSTGST